VEGLAVDSVALNSKGRICKRGRRCWFSRLPQISRPSAHVSRSPARARGALVQSNRAQDSSLVIRNEGKPDKTSS
jgi:hypothetical protein